MKVYNVNIEKNDKDRTPRMVEVTAENAQNAHKRVYMELDLDETIMTIFSKTENGRLVFRNSKGFCE